MKKYQTINVGSHSEDWYKFRTTGVDKEMSKRLGVPEFIGGTGASEIGIILGQTVYNPTTMQLFHYKVGTETPERFDSERMFHGRHGESNLGGYWQCWDGSELGYIDNYEKYYAEIQKLNLQDILMLNINDFNMAVSQLTKANDHVVRKALRHDGYIMNPDYPYLFTSLDFKSDKDGFPLIDINHKDFQASIGEVIGEFPVECKTIDKFAAAQFEYDFPPQYVSQLNIQMLLTDSYYGEIAVLVGGNHFFVRYYERSDYICKNILKMNNEFWEQRVLPARELFAKYKETGKEEYLGDIQALEPMPDHNPNYAAYLSNRHDSDVEKIDGKIGSEVYYMGIRALIYDGVKKRFDELSKEYKNNITYEFVKEKCDMMMYGEDGYMKYFKKEGGKNKELSLRGFKVKPKEEHIEELVKLIIKRVEEK